MDVGCRRFPNSDVVSNRARLIRIGALFIAAFIAAFAVSAMQAPNAAAAPGDCRNPPVPESPGQGLSGFFVSGPETAPPHSSDPFDSPDTSPFEQYGLSGLTWHAYDLGCGGTVRDPSGAVSTWTARTLFIPAKAGLAAIVGVTEAALNPTFLDVFDPFLEDLTDVLRSVIFSPLAPLAVMLTGLLLIARSTRQRVSESMTAVGWALLVMVLASAIFAWPKAATDATDSVISSAVGVVSAGFDEYENRVSPTDEEPRPPEKQIASRLYEGFIYPMWLTGEFCDPDSQAAQRYGQDILRAQALTWTEAAEARERGSSAIVATHQRLFDETAARVQQEDPVAYECMAGRSSAALESAILADIGMLVMAPFLLIGGFILIAAYIIIRFGVILAPALLTVGAFYPFRGIVQGVARIMAAAVINSVIFILCTLFVIEIDTMLLDPDTDLPAWLRIVLLGIVTVVMWYLTRPFRKLTSMVSARNFGHQMRQEGALVSSLGRGARKGLTMLRSRVPQMLDGSFDSTDRSSRPGRAEVEAPQEGVTRPEAAPLRVHSWRVNQPSNGGRLAVRQGRAGPARASSRMSELPPGPGPTSSFPGDSAGGNANHLHHAAGAPPESSPLTQRDTVRPTRSAAVFEDSGQPMWAPSRTSDGDGLPPTYSDLGDHAAYVPDEEFFIPSAHSVDDTTQRAVSDSAREHGR